MLLFLKNVRPRVEVNLLYTVKHIVMQNAVTLMMNFFTTLARYIDISIVCKYSDVFINLKYINVINGGNNYISYKSFVLTTLLTIKNFVRYVVCYVYTILCSRYS